MYIDNYKVEIKGTKYHEKTDKKMKDQVFATYQSTENMDIKKLSSLIEELADSHDAHQEIEISVNLKQHQYD